MKHYYKLVKNGIPFKDAYEYFKNGYCLEHGYIRYEPGDKFSLSPDDYLDDNWNVLEVDWSLESILEDVRDYASDNFDSVFDTRFEDIHQMDVHTIFGRIAEDTFTPQIIHKVLMQLKDAGFPKTDTDMA